MRDHKMNARPSLFWTLYRKEMASSRGLLGVAVLLFATWGVYLYTRVGVWRSGVPVVMAALPLNLLPLWAIWAGFTGVGSEWNNKTVYGWLSLPARGSVLLGSKTLALFTQALVLGAVPVLTTWILIHQPGELLAPFGAPVPDARTTRMILEAGTKIGVMAVLGVLDLAALAQLSSVAGKTVHRLQWLVSGGVFFGLFWLGGRLLGPLVDALRFLGSFPLVSGLNQPGSGGTAAVSTQQFPVAVPVLEVLGFVILFLAAALVLEKRAEA